MAEAVAPSSSLSVDDELAMLREIYFDEFRCLYRERDPLVLEFDIRPKTANDLSQQHVCLTIRFSLSSRYPHEVPTIEIRRERGITATQAKELLDDMNKLSRQRIGSQMMYDLIELANDRLTDNNRPFGDCPICLVSFRADDSFYKTLCFHYFHCACLAKYLKIRENDDCGDDSKRDPFPVCPVCRVKINVSLGDLEVKDESPEIIGDDAADGQAVKLSAPVIRWQKRMQRLFEKQKAKGGIIDVEAERKCQVLDISSTPSAPIGEAQKREETPTNPDLNPDPNPQPLPKAKNGFYVKVSCDRDAKQLRCKGNETGVNILRPPPGFGHIFPAGPPGKRPEPAGNSGSLTGRARMQEKHPGGRGRQRFRPPSARRKPRTEEKK